MVYTVTRCHGWGCPLTVTIELLITIAQFIATEIFLKHAHYYSFAPAYKETFFKINFCFAEFPVMMDNLIAVILERP